MLRHPSRRRPGNVLIWFAITVWVLFAMAALVVDLGLARARQRRLQTAADIAALEGMYETTNPSDAARAIELAFEGSPEGQITLEGGIPLKDGFNASQLLDVTANNAYRPDLELTISGDAADRTSTAITSGTSPYLFGRGSMLPSKYKGEGVRLRATSIAAARPVLAAGRPFEERNIPGAARLAINATSWTSWRSTGENSTARTITVTLKSDQMTFDNPVVGRFTSPVTDLIMIGDQPKPAALVGQPNPLERYLPLYDFVPGWGEVVVGFLHITAVTLNGSGVEIGLSMNVSGGNATTSLVKPLTGDPRALFKANFDIKDPLRAPALVR